MSIYYIIVHFEHVHLKMKKMATGQPTSLPKLSFNENLADQRNIAKEIQVGCKVKNRVQIIEGVKL